MVHCCTTTAGAGSAGPSSNEYALATLAEDTPSAWRELALRAEEAVVERDGDFEPEGWTLLHRTPVLSMISTRRARPEAPAAPVADLGTDDLVEIRLLLALREPGDVVPGCSDLRLEPASVHVGIRADETLIATAGLRFCSTRHAEIAFLATHPDHEGLGYAGAVVDVLVERARRSGCASWLRIRPDDAAVEGWRRRGFVPVHTAAVEHWIHKV
jgi:GNAT superfamily N-acetyltransferase